MTVGIRNDHEGNPEYPCSKYGYVIRDDGSSIKCECASWAGDGTNFGAAVDLSGRKPIFWWTLTSQQVSKSHQRQAQALSFYF